MTGKGRVTRIAVATATVAALSAMGGAVGGVLITVLLGVFFSFRNLEVGFPGLTSAVQLTAITSAFGAGFGVVLGPLLGWTLMRRVPLGRAIGETAFAAAVGVGIAFVAPIWGFSVLIYPVIAATVAALRLRFSYRVRDLPVGDRASVS